MKYYKDKIKINEEIVYIHSNYTDLELNYIEIHFLKKQKVGHKMDLLLTYTVTFFLLFFCIFQTFYQEFVFF